MAVDWKGEALIANVRAAAMRGVVVATELVRAEAVRMVLEPPKTGRIYKRGGVQHQASAPGEAPASDTGRLAGSIRTEYQTEQLMGTVQASTEYAPFLELGTTKMEPRPFMRPALANKRAEVEAAVNDEVQAELG